MARNRELGWDLESLNKAYQQGYMAAQIHMAPARCPYQTEAERRSQRAGIFIA